MNRGPMPPPRELDPKGGGDGVGEPQPEPPIQGTSNPAVCGGGLLNSGYRPWARSRRSPTTPSPPNAWAGVVRSGGRCRLLWQSNSAVAAELLSHPWRGGGGGGLTWVDENDDKNKPPKAVRNGWLFG
jgi:hypothetical protein